MTKAIRAGWGYAAQASADHADQGGQLPRARIGIVCPYSFARPGGVQNHVLGLAGWLNREGSTVQIFAPDEPPPGMLESYGLVGSHYVLSLIHI